MQWTPKTFLVSNFFLFSFVLLLLGFATGYKSIARPELHVSCLQATAVSRNSVQGINLVPVIERRRGYGGQHNNGRAGENGKESANRTELNDSRVPTAVRKCSIV